MVAQRVTGLLHPLDEPGVLHGLLMVSFLGLAANWPGLAMVILGSLLLLTSVFLGTSDPLP